MSFIFNYRSVEGYVLNVLESRPSFLLFSFFFDIVSFLCVFTNSVRAANFSESIVLKYFFWEG